MLALITLSTPSVNASAAEWVLQTGTKLEEAGENFEFCLGDYNGDGVLDLYAIKKRATGSKTTEVHTLTIDGSQVQQKTDTKLVVKSDNVSWGNTALSTALYKSNSGVISCGFDGYEYLEYHHEGIDFVKGYDSSVYSLIDGVITRVTEGANGSKGLSTIAIYSEATGKTVVYLHTNPLDSLKPGQTVTKGQKIATEAWRSCSKASDTHTHVEVRNGRHTAAAISRNCILENENPTSFWNSQGYAVK